MLDGSLIVYQKGKLKIEISADDIAPRLPICEANTDEIKVNARKKCRILHFNRNLYDILTTHSDDMSIEVEESEDGTDALFVEIYQAYVGGYLKVPSLPGLVLRIRKAVSDPNSSAADISRMIQADPAMVGRLIQVVNSAAFKSENQIDDCQMAIMRLGLSTTQDMVIGFALKNLFTGQTVPMKKRMTKLWRQTTQVAALSMELSKQLKILTSERALLPGLIHNVGAMTILAYSDTFLETDPEQFNLQFVLDKLRGQVGAIVINQWGAGSRFCRSCPRGR